MLFIASVHTTSPIIPAKDLHSNCKTTTDGMIMLQRMTLVKISGQHRNKVTGALLPSSNLFIATTSGQALCHKAILSGSLLPSKTIFPLGGTLLPYMPMSTVIGNQIPKIKTAIIAGRLQTILNKNKIGQRFPHSLTVMVILCLLRTVAPR